MLVKRRKKMKEIIYVPILKANRGEITAYKLLEIDHKKKYFPYLR